VGVRARIPLHWTAQYAQRFFRPIQDLSEKFNILQAAMASSERQIFLSSNDWIPTPTRFERNTPAP
jgi:hypothetical protein